MKGITKQPCLNRIADWIRLNFGELEEMLGKPEEWVEENLKRGKKCNA